MHRNIIRFIVIYLSFVLVFLTFAVYRDIRINKLFNYSKKPEDINFEEVVRQNGTTGFEYNFSFTATDNYLGAVFIPVRRLAGVGGEVVFKIEDKDNSWFHENRYDYNYFRSLDSYIFGFPVIEDSFAKEYQISLIFTSIDNPLFESFVDEDVSELLLAKYVFPRKVALEDPAKFLSIIKTRAIASAVELDYIRISSIILVLSLAVLLISKSNFLVIDKKSTDSFFQFVMKILKPEYGTFFFVPTFLLLISIPLAIIFNRFLLAEKMVNYIWIFLLVGLAWYVITSLLIRYLQETINLIINLRLKLASSFKPENLKRNLIFIFLALILISGFKKTYYLGGDDSRLFYLYPRQFLENFAVKIVSDTSMSNIVTLAPPATAPFTILMLILKKLVGPLNLQSLLYTSNIIGGLIFFYLLVDWLIPYKNKSSYYINAVVSLSYVFSVFNIYILFASRLIAIFLISLFPLSLYLFLKAVKEKRPMLLFVLAIIGSVFSFFTLAAPWFLAALISVIPLLLYLLWAYKTRTLKYLLFLGILMLVLNFHWIIFLPYSSFFGQSRGTFDRSLVSEGFRKENEIGIQRISEITSVFYPMMNTYHRSIQEDFNWSYYPIFLSWSAKILPFNILYLGLVLIAGLTLRKFDKQKALYASSLLSLLLALYFFTVNITAWGTQLFVWLNNNVPGFVLFRNMYDKFAYALSFNFALILAFSLNILTNNIKNNKIKNYLLTSFILIILINTKPLLFGEYARIPVWTTKNTYDSITSFNDDFMQMTDYISRVENPGKYLILPLATGNAFPVQDKYKTNHYYNGVSPLLVLTGKNDFSGILSFGAYGEDVFNLIREKKYYELGRILQKFNVKYIIVNHTINEELRKSFVYSGGLYYLQGEEMIRSLVGEKIKDFGLSYSLYEISKDFDSEKIYLTSDREVVPKFNNLRYSKLDSHLYDIEIDEIGGNGNLIFLDPYLDGWQLVTESEEEVVEAPHFVALGYANGWSLEDFDKDKLKSGLKLFFKPYDYFWPANIISIAGYFISFLIILKSISKKINK